RRPAGRRARRPRTAGSLHSRRTPPTVSRTALGLALPPAPVPMGTTVGRARPRLPRIYRPLVICECRLNSSDQRISPEVINPEHGARIAGRSRLRQETPGGGG